MENLERKAHWQKIYTTKPLQEVSWYQAVPIHSLDLLADCKLPKDAAIIDVGGGDSFLVDSLLDLGYTDLTVLDISQAAINRAQERLGERAKKVQWITTDVTLFNPTKVYDLWHDRAAFHFLSQEKEIQSYQKRVAKSLSEKGILVLGTFSMDGPTKCSGIPIQRYSEERLARLFANDFIKLNGKTVAHATPFNTVQSFVFCTFRKL